LNWGAQNWTEYSRWGLTRADEVKALYGSVKPCLQWQRDVLVSAELLDINSGKDSL